MSRRWCCGREIGLGLVVCRDCVGAGGTVNRRCRGFPHEQRRFREELVR